MLSKFQKEKVRKLLKEIDELEQKIAKMQRAVDERYKVLRLLQNPCDLVMKED